MLIDPADMVAMALWGRGLAKSSNVEWTAIGEGALIGYGYVGYVCGTQQQADEHVAEIQKRLESDAVSEHYPGLSRPKISEHGNQYGWRQNFLLTASGWAIRPIGLNTKFRGGRVGDLRPTMLIFDDLDEIDDSLSVTDKKIARISGSILPAGTENTVVLVAQNPIHKNSVVNQIYTRRIDVLADRTIIGGKLIPSFEEIDIQTRQTPTGPRNVIVSAKPTWEHLNLRAAQVFLGRSGLERFKSEYQHDFSGVEQKRVIPEFDEAIHVISWSQFEAVFGCRYIPKHWYREVGHDIGYTREHLSSWSFVATSAMNSKIPNLKFLYRGLNFTEPLLDDMAAAVVEILKPDPGAERYFDERDLISKWKMSHEKKGERMTYRAKYQLPFTAVDFSKSDGISQWRHFLRADHTIKHPFLEDEKLDDGRYLLGCPAYYYIVDDDQQAVARDDAGLLNHRREVLNWEYRKSVQTDTGLSVEQPVKAFDDAADSQRMITCTWGPNATELTPAEEQEEALPAHAKIETIAKVEDDQTRSQLLLARRAAVQKYEDDKRKKEYGWRKLT